MGVLVTSVFVVGVPGVTPAGAAGPPVITVSPSTDLGLNPTVQVAGTGWSNPDQKVYFAECVGLQVDQSHCIPLAEVATTVSGDFSPMGVHVHRVVNSHDCASESCKLVGLWPLGLNPTESATFPLQFDPTIPLPGPGTLDVSPGIIVYEPGPVTVSGSGMVASTQFQLQQCVPLTGCDPTTTVLASTNAAGTLAPTNFTMHRHITVEDGDGNMLPVDCGALDGLQCAVEATGAGASVTSPAIYFPVPPNATLSASPDSGLTDGQTVSIAGSGLPSYRWSLVECAPIAGCDPTTNAGYVSSNPDGTLGPVDFTVHQNIVGTTIIGPVPVDCTVSPCYVMLSGGGPWGPAAPLSFAAGPSGGGTLTGHVVNSDGGVPVGDAAVGWCASPILIPIGSCSGAGAALTDPTDGSYSWRLPAGTYSVGVTNYVGGPWHISGLDLVTVMDGQTLTCDFVDAPPRPASTVTRRR
jgi:hypothetical protein